MFTNKSEEDVLNEPNTGCHLDLLKPMFFGPNRKNNLAILAGIETVFVTAHVLSMYALCSADSDTSSIICTNIMFGLTEIAVAPMLTVFARICQMACCSRPAEADPLLGSNDIACPENNTQLSIV